MHNEMERQYIIYIPDGLPADAPLVFVFHGYGGSANEVKNNTDMNAVADEYLFAVCYPQGTKDAWNYNFWQVGYDFHIDEDVDDVDFVDSLAHYLWDEYNLSPENTFSTGISNGGDMSYLNACQNTDVFKAIAPVAGSLMKWIHDSCDLSSPVPVFEIHGTDDNITLWEGDLDNSDGWGAYYDVPYTYNFWAAANNCTIESIDTLDDIDPADGSFVVSHKYANTTDYNESWLYEVVGGGHDWPGIWGNMDINSSEEIWNFFSKYVTEPVTIATTQEENSLHVFPNPSNGFLSITCNSSMIGSDFSIYYITGEKLLTDRIVAPQFTLDMNSFVAGMYLISIGDNTAYKFTIVEK
ncbi:MAG: PHB depolymerase family esterase [Chitinophagales bacterium]